jgi:hypothetical protein
MYPSELPTAAPTLAPSDERTKAPSDTDGVCHAPLDVVFVLDESGSFNEQEFAELKEFVIAIVEKLRFIDYSIRYALTLFSRQVRSEVLLGDGLNSDDAITFQALVAGLNPQRSLTCMSGGMSAAFHANSGLLSEPPIPTRLRPGVPVALFVVTDGIPNFHPPEESDCFTATGDCTCSETDHSMVSSESVYKKIKAAASQVYPNRVIAMEVGKGVDAEILEGMSDAQLSSEGTSNLGRWVNQAVQLLTCGDSTSSPPVAASESPNQIPSEAPAVSPAAFAAKETPTQVPSKAPSVSPTTPPSANPSETPTAGPSANPSGAPTAPPSTNPNVAPTAHPSVNPSVVPTAAPSANPTAAPTSRDNPVADAEPLPTVAPTVAPVESKPTSNDYGLCHGDFDIILVIDLSDNIEAVEFNNFKRFVTHIINVIKSSSGTVRFALSSFVHEASSQDQTGAASHSTAAVVRSIQLGEELSTDPLFNSDFLSRGMCPSGVLTAAFYSNFGELTSDGGFVNPQTTRLRAGVPAVFLVMTDQNPDLKPSPASACKTASGDCSCETATDSFVPTETAYMEIKDAESTNYPNRVVALQVGNDIDARFLPSVSDRHVVADFSTTTGLRSAADETIQYMTCDYAP